MNKKIVVFICLILLGWFFLDMIGLSIDGKFLVTRSYSEDLVFFIIYFISLLLFIFKEKIGKYVLNVWLLMWFITQFLSHWYFTLTNQGVKKIEYFKDTIKMFNDSSRYIPDLYHILLHIFILTALISLNVYNYKNKKI